MDLYGKYGASWPQKAVLVALELLFLALAAWILFGAGGPAIAGLFGWPVAEATPLRYWLIFGFSLTVLIRMGFMMVFFMKRAVPWSEAFTVPVAFALYYVGFAVLVLPAIGAFDWIDALGIVLFVVGSYLNTGGELQRHAFKKDPANKGKLFTGGLFGLSMHINFFGDILWVAGYALVTHNWWSSLIVIFIVTFFAFYNVPMLDKHLAEHYGADFEAYRKKTKRLVPFVW